ncbi:MAG: potassium-transporting ATPase subunit KdpA [Candidatus Melainabacteria bacterium HGW-Melainabacteria-1]|nr:MAG: potassium-transporting ATPase subunit KdpA [Candidatus Melainabacteria bacterium HGW-Melainabacteria-1]
MQLSDWIQIILFLIVLFAAMPILGNYMAKVYQGEKTWLHPMLQPLEKLIYTLGGVKAEAEMNWKRYTLGLLWFHLFGFLILFGLQLLQKSLPLNPAGINSVELGVAFNTAVSFVTNTNWQAYSGESGQSYLTQMLGMTVQNFVSAATGMAVLVALIRGITRKQTQNLGNFWADLTRTTVYILLPLSLVLALAISSQGVVQSLDSYQSVTTLEGAEQVIPLGPAASQIAIKQLGTNGGGFFGLNSAHPFENATPFSNLLQMLSLLLIPMALCWAYGRMVGSLKQGMTILATMLILYLGLLSVAMWAEFQPNQIMGISQALEGKELRHGIVNSVLWGTSTTVTSNGSVNAMHDSFSPLAGGVMLFNMLLGEVVFGGVGCGLYGMLLLVLLTVFIAGLMVGRTPEYLGKKIEAFDIRLAAVAIVLPSAAVLLFTAIGVSIPAGTGSFNNAGPHGLSEALYAFASQANNNGSAFAGFGAAAPYYAWVGALAMLIGRFGVLIPTMAIAGSLAAKKVTPPSAGTFPTDGGMFVVLLLSVVLIVGALTFFPVLSLGPIVEHFLQLQGRTF